MVLGNVSLASLTLLFVACIGSLQKLTAEPPSVVKIKADAGTFELLRNGQSYFIKGVGGNGSRKLLVQSGANSIRTWGADDLGKVLDEAAKDGLTVTAGIWLGHADVFDYHNADNVKKQLEMCKQVVQRYKDHPALLIWALGNEMEGNGEDPKVWQAINDIALEVKKIDPHHPTMTVIAEIGGEKVKNLHQICAAIDIIGINSYGGAPSLADRYKKLGGKKPYILTEFGTPGPWETKKTRWDAPIEPSSTQKSDHYRKSYLAAVLNMKGTCLGSYAFLWGNKQEATATWFGMLLPDGAKLGPVDVMTELWTKKKPKNLAPKIKKMTVSQSDQLKPDQIISANLECLDPEGKPIKVKWTLVSEARERLTAGRDEAIPPGFPGAVIESSSNHAKVKMPKSGGAYRLFAYVFDEDGAAAVANQPLFVAGPSIAHKGVVTRLPLAIYAESPVDMPFAPTGWMGMTSGISVDFECKSNPHSGQNCARFTYSSPAGWAGIACQFPANDWGDKPESLDLSKAKRLAWWMRGENGGEKVSVEFGILRPDKTYFDSGNGKLEITLQKEWKEYQISTVGKDLTNMKTGFVVTIAGTGRPQTFFFDDVRYE